MTAIRLIGEHHTTDHGGRVLTIADEATARTNPNTVTLEHARKLVAFGSQLPAIASPLFSNSLSALR